MTTSFTADDYALLSEMVMSSWVSARDADWSRPAGTLEWSCWTTAEHLVDCEFSYALFLASRCQDAYPKFAELDALPDASPADLLDGLRAVTTMLHAVIVTTEPTARSIIRMRPPTTGTPLEFAARGALEMILHAHDIATGLGVAFDPPTDLCHRLWTSTRDWFPDDVVVATDDPWSDLLARSGRARPD